MAVIRFVLDAREAPTQLSLIQQMLAQRNVSLERERDELIRPFGYRRFEWELQGEMSDLLVVVDLIHELTLVQLQFNFTPDDDFLTKLAEDLPAQQLMSDRLSERIQIMRQVMLKVLGKLLPSPPSIVEVTEYINPKAYSFVPYLSVDTPVYVRQTSLARFNAFVHPDLYKDLFFISDSPLPRFFPEMLNETSIILEDLSPYQGLTLARLTREIPIGEIRLIQERISERTETKTKEGYVAVRLPANLRGVLQELSIHWKLSEIGRLDDSDFLIVRLPEEWRPKPSDVWLRSSCQRIAEGKLPQALIVSPPIETEFFLAATLRAYAKLVNEKPHLATSLPRMDFSRTNVWLEFSTLEEWQHFEQLQGLALREPMWVERGPIAWALALRKKIPTEMFMIRLPTRDLSQWTVVMAEDPQSWTPTEEEISETQREFRAFLAQDCHEAVEPVTLQRLTEMPPEELVTLVKTEEPVPYCYSLESMRQLWTRAVNPVTLQPFTRPTLTMFQYISTGFVRGSGFWGDGFFPGLMPKLPTMPKVKPANEPIYLKPSEELTVLAFRGDDQDPHPVLSVRSSPEFEAIFNRAWSEGGLLTPWGFVQSSVGRRSSYPFIPRQFPGLIAEGPMRFFNVFLRG